MLANNDDMMILHLPLKSRLIKCRRLDYMTEIGSLPDRTKIRPFFHLAR